LRGRTRPSFRHFAGWDEKDQKKRVLHGIVLVAIIKHGKGLSKVAVGLRPDWEGTRRRPSQGERTGGSGSFFRRLFGIALPRS